MLVLGSVCEDSMASFGTFGSLNIPWLRLRIAHFVGGIIFSETVLKMSS